jgi:hypothetical protein
MTSTPAGRRRQAEAPRSGRAILVLSLAIPVVTIAAAATFIIYVLWPRWPGPQVEPSAPSLPVTIAGTAFNVPPAAVRMPVQRRPGAHERIDLVYLWPSLDPPGTAAVDAAAAPVGPLDRIFVTLAAAGDTLPPDERVRMIYPRYMADTPTQGPGGLTVLAFRDDSPYRGEDLIYLAAEPAALLVRCSRNAAGPTPGICFSERRIEHADVTVRFPRDWLADWRPLADRIERLITDLRPPAD